MLKQALLLLLTGCSLFVLSANAQTKNPKSLVIMLDGARADIIHAAHTPNMLKLITNTWQKDYSTAYADNAQTMFDAAPNSAPNHIGIATGVSATKHRAFGNGQTASANYAEYPHYLSRLKRANPDFNGAHFYQWEEDGQIQLDSGVRKYQQWDDKILLDETLKTLSDDQTDALLLYIDGPDGCGHATGFYPYGKRYIEMIAKCDQWLGQMLNTITQRKNFKNEDWQIILCSDHGGFLTDHGMWGGHATTIPLLITGKQTIPGKIQGLPSNFDTAVTTLDHFGIDTASLNLDGKVQGQKTQKIANKNLQDDLILYLPFDNNFDNVVSHPLNLQVKNFNELITLGRNQGVFGNAAIFDAANKGYLQLSNSEKLNLTDSDNFTATMWVKLPASQSGDSLLLSNKDWSNGLNPGFSFTASRNAPTAATAGIMLNYANGTTRTDLGQMNNQVDQWMFLAIVKDNNNTVYLYQGIDGYLYHIAANGENWSVKTNLPWNIGQDGSGNYACSLTAHLDDFAIWNRGLERSEIEKIYQANRKGVSLGSLLQEQK